MSEDKTVTSLFRKREGSATKKTISTAEGIQVTPDMMVPAIYIQRFHKGFVLLDEIADVRVNSSICDEPVDGWFWGAIQRHMPSEYFYYHEDQESKAYFEESISLSEWRFVYEVADKSLFSAQLEVAVALSRRDDFNVRSTYYGSSVAWCFSAWLDGDELPHKLKENTDREEAISEAARLKSLREYEERRKSNPLLNNRQDIRKGKG